MNVASARRLAIALVLVASVVALSGCATKPASSYQVGQTVAAKWTDGNFWLAKVTAAEDAQVSVQFLDDNSKLTIAASDVRAIKPTTWAVGSSVYAVWSSGRFYPGKITAASGGTYTVKWDDGSAPTQVAADKIMAVP